MNLHSEAEVLAELIIALSADTEQNKKLFKLPPVFSAKNHKKYGNGKNNLVAIIKCSADYEDLNKNYRCTLVKQIMLFYLLNLNCLK